MDVLEGILENDPSDAESDNEEAVSCDNSDDNDHEVNRMRI